MVDVRKIDPTGTTPIANRFARAMAANWAQLARDVRSLVEAEDAFGLRQNDPLRPTLNERFRFTTSAQKVASFEKWLEAQLDEGVLVDEIGGISSDVTKNVYVRSAYRSGVVSAYRAANKDNMRQPMGAFYQGSVDDFVNDAFDSPVTVSKLQLMGTRVFTALKGVNQVMASGMTRILTQGIADGRNPRDLARDMVKEITGISKVRALRIARTEVVHAHAEATLDTFDKLGVIDLTVMAEWSTAGDDRVCALCSDLEGVVLKVDEARGLLPRHPNCRCTWVPAGIGEESDKQKTTAKSIQRSIDRSTKRQFPKRTSLLEARRRSKWAGADAKIKRPEKAIPKDGLRAPAAEVWGHQPTAVMRWMGANGFSEDEARQVLEARGLKVNASTLKIQIKAGADGLGKRGAPAALTQTQQEELNDALRRIRGGGIPDKTDVPPIVVPDTSQFSEEIQKISKTALVRWMGSKGFTPKQAQSAFRELGIEIAEGTVKTQINKGIRGTGAIPTVSSALEAALTRNRSLSPPNSFVTAGRTLPTNLKKKPSPVVVTPEGEDLRRMSAEEFAGEVGSGDGITSVNGTVMSSKRLMTSAFESAEDNYQALVKFLDSDEEINELYQRVISLTGSKGDVLGQVSLGLKKTLKQNLINDGTVVGFRGLARTMASRAEELGVPDSLRLWGRLQLKLESTMRERVQNLASMTSYTSHGPYTDFFDLGTMTFRPGAIDESPEQCLEVYKFIVACRRGTVLKLTKEFDEIGLATALDIDADELSDPRVSKWVDEVLAMAGHGDPERIREEVISLGGSYFGGVPNEYRDLLWEQAEEVLRNTTRPEAVRDKVVGALALPTRQRQEINVVKLSGSVAGSDKAAQAADQTVQEFYGPILRRRGIQVDAEALQDLQENGDDATLARVRDGVKELRRQVEPQKWSFGVKTFDLDDEPRAYASPWRSNITIAEQETPTTIVHEVGHLLESQPYTMHINWADYEISKTISVDRALSYDGFIKKKMHSGNLTSPSSVAGTNWSVLDWAEAYAEGTIKKSGKADKRLKDLNEAYDASEVGNEDGWRKLTTAMGLPSPAAPYYIGKLYKDGSTGSVSATETISMGMEMLYRDGVEFAKTDPTYFKFMVAILRDRLGVK